MILGISLSNALGQGPYDVQWKEVETLVRKGQPQSALKIVEDIYAASRLENNAPEFLKAALYQIKLRADYQEDFMETSLAQISGELPDAQPPLKQILHSIRAELYWRYYQGNRYLFLDRTRMTTPDLADIKTWDLETLIGVVGEDYRSSLSSAELLRQTRLSGFDPILVKAEGSELYRPTLYDFLAHRAVDFFMNDEPGITRPAAAFNLDKEEYFRPAAQFSLLALPEEAGNDEFKLQAMMILRDLIAFHLLDEDPAALIDADLKRLRFVLLNSVFPEKYQAFLAALNDLRERYSGNMAVADVFHEIALEYYRRGEQYNPFLSDRHRWDLKTAKETCESAINGYPGTNGARNCMVLLNSILEPSLNLQFPDANLPGKPFLASLSYKNIPEVHFRVVRIDPDEFRSLRMKEQGEPLVDRYKRLVPEKEWSQKLPDEGDLQDHNVKVSIPALGDGFYLLMAAPDPALNSKRSVIAYAPFWMTSISYISSGGRDGEPVVIDVLDRQKGTPLKGVRVSTFTQEYDYQTRTYGVKALESYLTDDTGRISIPAHTSASKSFYIDFSRGNDRYLTSNYFYVYPAPREEQARNITHFFTDRSIYRPGQTIYFKGIVLKKTGEKHEIIPGESSTVTLYDANHQKVSELLLTTNDFGSFQGSFTLPQGVLTGEMSLENPWGRISFSVEEYKRPRFRVEIDSLEGNYKLNETVSVNGKALNYSGNPVDRAAVSFRVVRTARFPVWRDWWSWFPSMPETEIISGQTTTAADGSFNFTFEAIPDLAVERKFQPVFSYRIYVDVTDITGEVRSAEELVSVGYQALLIDARIPEKLDLNGKTGFTLAATNLNGRPVQAEGTLTIFPLQSPGRLIRDWRGDRPDMFVIGREEFLKLFPNELYSNENDPETWPRKAPVYTIGFNTAESASFAIGEMAAWEPGTYLALIESKDAFGDTVSVKKYITAFHAAGKEMPVEQSFWHAVIKNEGEPGETAVILAGTAEKNARLLFEVENRGRVIEQKWVELSEEIRRFEVPIREEYRGNFFINLVLVKENRSYRHTEKITVPYTDKTLDISLETFRDKLIPGQDEEWRIRVTGAKGDLMAAEMLASMYDASLDAFREHAWSFDLYPMRYAVRGWETTQAFGAAVTNRVFPRQDREITPVSREYDRLNWFGFDYYGSPYPYRGGRLMMKSLDGMPGMAQQAEAMEDRTEAEPAEEVVVATAGQAVPEKEPDVPVRRNFAETAFFFPSLKTDEHGDIILKFSVPESLTAWKLMMLAHTTDLKAGYLEQDVVTRKDLMVMANAPRFFREGDRIAFSAKVVSMTKEILKGQVTAEFFNALTMQPVDEMLGNEIRRQSFSVAAGASQVIYWQISIPQGLEAIVCRVKAVSGDFADGEEFLVPVLPNRMLVTESLPLPISGKGMKEFKFSRLVNSGKSASLKNYRLTLEFTSNPAWYAVQALPYLAENQHESADNLFARYYANSLASFIANANPKILQVIEAWKALSPDAFLSNLEKNPELKSVLLQETPWVMEARNESERKKRIALLFDLNRMAGEQEVALRKLQQMQAPNGGWSWFDGMPDNRYITQLIVTGIGKLQHLGVIDLKKDQELVNMVRRAMIYLDERAREDYEKIREYSGDKVGENHLSAIHVQYLYAHSFLKDFQEVSPSGRESFRYFQEQASLYWLQQGKYVQGMIALALHRFGIKDIPMQIITSLRENSLKSEEMGMYWRDLAGFYWHEAPVERQAMMIEAFGEVAGDNAAVEEMKIWLLKQKQTQDWKSTRATADAVYALLLRGTDLLASDELVQVTVGSEPVDPLSLDGVQVQAGTGYFQASWQGADIKPEMGNVKVEKKDHGVAWGALYWQYYEQLDKITPAKTPLSIEKELYVRYNTPDGPELVKVAEETSLKTGDRVISRIIIRVDRDMEYVHMKDMRAAAFEPVEAISGYRYQGGLGYYESIRDASVNFYFDYLRKGTYVFEYPLNVTQKGEFSNGITTIQCLYAPEFAAHSQGTRVWVE